MRTHTHTLRGALFGTHSRLHTQARYERELQIVRHVFSPVTRPSQYSALSPSINTLYKTAKHTTITTIIEQKKVPRPKSQSQRRSAEIAVFSLLPCTQVKYRSHKNHQPNRLFIKITQRFSGNSEEDGLGHQVDRFLQSANIVSSGDCHARAHTHTNGVQRALSRSEYFFSSGESTAQSVCENSASTRIN